MSKKVGKQSMTQYQERVAQARTVRKIVFICVTAFIALMLVLGIGAYIYINMALKSMDAEGKGHDVHVSIPMGSTTTKIGTILEKQGVIRNATVFRYYTRYKNAADFQAGEYKLSTEMDLDQVIAMLQDPSATANAANSFIIPEGWTLAQIAERVAEHVPETKKEVLAKLDDRDYVKSLIEKYTMLKEKEILAKDVKHPLEGYLYPSRYDFAKDELSLDAAIEAMLDRMQKVVDEQQALIDQSNYSVHELLTIGSIVEREAEKEEDRFQIAGVLHNRLKQEMKLQVDPTVSYAKGEHLYMTTYEDLEVDSPYNTYQHEGLPPGPIANMREASFIAAADPTRTDYLYFYARHNGEIIYNVDYEARVKARDKYKHEWQEKANDE